MKKNDLKKKIKLAVTNSPFADNIKSVSLFGSYAKETAVRNSDIDLLIEFHKPIGFFSLVRLQDGLRKQLKKPVDIVTPRSLSKYFRASVLRHAEKVYGR